MPGFEDPSPDVVDDEEAIRQHEELRLVGLHSMLRDRGHYLVDDTDSIVQLVRDSENAASNSRGRMAEVSELDTDSGSVLAMVRQSRDTPIAQRNDMGSEWCCW